MERVILSPRTEFLNGKCAFHLLVCTGSRSPLILFFGKKLWKWNEGISLEISIWDWTRPIYNNTVDQPDFPSKWWTTFMSGTFTITFCNDLQPVWYINNEDTNAIILSQGCRVIGTCSSICENKVRFFWLPISYLMSVSPNWDSKCPPKPKIS